MQQDDLYRDGGVRRDLPPEQVHRGQDNGPTPPPSMVLALPCQVSFAFFVLPHSHLFNKEKETSLDR
jgi:hypothetical protein